MAVREILHYPDPRLRIAAKAVVRVNDEVKRIVDDLLETMYHAPGIGLAATQVDIHLRIIVVDVSVDQSQPLCLINPKIIKARGAQETQEGCLSVPDIFEPVTRAETVRVRALNREGQTTEFEAEGLLAVCIQHEADHLDGTLFVDHLSALKRTRLRKKFDKIQRRAG